MDYRKLSSLEFDKLSRRAFLAGGIALLGVPRILQAARGNVSFPTSPFTLGVASGDPTPTGGVLWTRLAPRPLDPDVGMGGVRSAVSWQLADDEKFTNIVKQGRATAAPELGYSVHVDVDGLAPDR